jgi:glutaredoxin-like protein NrdH
MTRSGDDPIFNRITVHTKPGCIQCKATLRALQRAGLKFVTIDVSTDPQARDFVMSLGYLQAPVVVGGNAALEWLPSRPDRRTHRRRRMSLNRRPTPYRSPI